MAIDIGTTGIRRYAPVRKVRSKQESHDKPPRKQGQRDKPPARDPAKGRIDERI